MPFLEQTMAQFSEFHFLRPEWFYAFIPILLLFLLLKARAAVTSNWSRSIDSALLPYLIEQSEEGIQRNPFYLLLIAWLLIIIALAGPVWEKTPQPVHIKEDALIIVLDLSFSMYAVDIKPNRLTRARQKLLDVLKKRQEGVTGLIVYAGDAHAVSPLTDDANTIASMVPALSPDIMPIYGSAFAPAMELALQMFRNGNVSSGRILLITDEIPDMASSQNIAQDNPADFPLSILSIGTAAGAPIMIPGIGRLKDSRDVIVIPGVDFAALQDLADAVGGRHTAMSVDNTDIDYLLDESIVPDEEQFREIERYFDVWYEQGPWLVLLILPLAALAFRRGWIWCLVLLLISPQQDVYAAEENAPTSISQFWQDLWQTGDQQGIIALQQGDAQRAAAVFKDPAWKGSASYLGGNYQQAEEIFQNLETPDSQYNLGNTFARQNKYQEAIAAYDKTLAADPENEDAIFNKELIEKLLQEQQQQNQNEQNSDQDQQSDPQSGENEQGDSDQQQKEQQQSDQDQRGEQEQEQAEQEPEDTESEEQQADETEQQADEQQLAEAQESELDEEAKQALEQWLRRVPDDPGGLLRRKFEYQTQQRKQKGQGKFDDRDAVW